MDENNKNNSGSGTPGGGMNKRAGIVSLIAAGVLFLIFLHGLNVIQQSANREIDYNEFIKMVDDGKVESVLFNSNRIDIVPKQSTN